MGTCPMNDLINQTSVLSYELLPLPVVTLESLTTPKCGSAIQFDGPTPPLHIESRRLHNIGIVVRGSRDREWSIRTFEDVHECVRFGFFRDV